MNPTKMAEKQRFLAKTANEHPDHRFTNLYDLLHWDCWMHTAAERVLARPGSQTDGVDGKTRDAFKKDYEGQITALIDQLKRRTYEPQPVRRIYIPKHDGKQRPLGIPALRDRIVQEALRAILDPIYESDFHPHSYGFRKGRCTMDAIAVLMPMFNTSLKHYYVIEGDLQSYFDTVHHRTLMKLLRRRLKDRALLDLIWKFLKAGVMEGGLFQHTESGVPQGGVISPLLANVYLNEFDKWAAAQWDLDPNARRRRRYAGLGNYKMVRYADDFVVVANSPIAEVKATKQAIQQFLENKLHLTLSEEKTVKLELSREKTLITHATSQAARFLGYELVNQQANDQFDRNGRRRVNGQIGLRVPADVIEQHCQAYMRKGKPAHRSYLLHDEDFSIVAQYQSEFRGVVNYYLLAYNVSHFGKLKGVMEMSLARTLAAKHKSTARKMQRQYKSVAETEHGPRVCLKVVKQQDNGKRPKVAYFGGIPLKRQRQAVLVDQQPQRYRAGRNELTKRLLADTCEMCDSTVKVEIHHIRALRDLNVKGQREKPKWVQLMAARKRKTLAVCRTCHMDIHHGRINPQKQT